MMDETSATAEFLAHIEALPPGAPLDNALKPAIEFESELRKLYATDPQNTRLSEPHVGLIDVFNAPEAIKVTRARVVQNDTEDLSAKYIMALNETRRRKDGAPCMVPDLDEFKKNWAIFTEGSLSQLLDWNNVIAAGGSVLACLTPLDEAAKKSKRSIRKFYHNNAYPSSDVDLFLWGLNAEQAEAKINTIYEAVRDSVPWDVTCVRTKHTVSIHSQYPYRSVQIVLRLYQSPAEILAGFDIDAPCCAYDGSSVWANPRAIAAIMRQCNTVDMSRRSPSYEVRLAKYSVRGYEVHVPGLRRQDIDPTIYERSIAKMEGLARLLVLERLTDTDTRYAFLESRRTLRGRPQPTGRTRQRNKRTYKGDLKSDTIIGGLEQNDYDVQSLHIPYGPGWDARRIDKLIYQTDLGMNSTFNPKNKGRRLHRHPAFFGTGPECLEDCCEMCPDPIDEDERKLQEGESEKYIRGRIKFIEENPGRQTMTGSFKPIDVGEWSEQVYIKPTQQLFSAIAAQDRETVKLLIKDLDVNQRDHVGRTCLHVAIICKASVIACDLIDAGARITARLVDGRTPLHLASQLDLVDLIRKLFEKSAQNAEAEKLKNPDKVDNEDDKKGKEGKKPSNERLSSEDDWSSHSDDDVDMVDASEAKEPVDAGDENEDDEKEGEGDDDEGGTDDDNGSEGSHPVPERSPTPHGDIPEDETEEPDVIDSNLLDWDFGFTALSYAVLFASPAVVDLLLANNVDLTISTKRNSYPPVHLHPLDLTLLREDEDEACQVAERLITAGASCTTANERMWTTFHSAVACGRFKLVNTFLKCDKNAPMALNFPSLNYQDVTFPVATAVAGSHYAVLSVLLSNGARLELDEADITKAQDAAHPDKRLQTYDKVDNYTQCAYQAVETAMSCQDDGVRLLLALGAPINVGIKTSLRPYAYDTDRATLVDYVNASLTKLKKRISEAEKQKKANVKAKALPKKASWKQYIDHYKVSLKTPLSVEVERRRIERTLMELNDTKAYMEDVKRLLIARGAKSWKEVYPDVTSAFVLEDDDEDMDEEKEKDEPIAPYMYIAKAYNRRRVEDHLKKSYDELFTACYAGDDKKIEKLCKPPAGSKTRPLNISVYVPSDSNTWGRSEGYTPLFAAISGRHWSTCKLILSIVTSQYEPEEKDKKFKAKILSLTGKVDSDGSGSDTEGDSDMDSDEDADTERDEPKFVDVAGEGAVMKSDISPRKFLDIPGNWRIGKESGSSHVLRMAIANKDVETFVQIANLYRNLPGKDSNLDGELLHDIVSSDCPDILDEFIRRTGFGIEIKLPNAADGEDEEQIVVNDGNRLYLGLNVHGKKRKDLATRNDPNAQQDHKSPPLVWLAASIRAKAIVEYLSTNRPLAAYRNYASSNSDTRAIMLRRNNELETILPSWLGWSTNDVGDSPLTAAIIGKDVETFKLLLTKDSSLMNSALNRRIKYVGYNLLMLAVRLKNKPDMIDLLLSKSLDPTAHDDLKGWNIHHHICDSANAASFELLDHLLEKLPRDVNEELLRQQSKGRLNTPLHIAVHSRNFKVVKRLFEYDPETLSIRNVDGQTPLHIAVKKSYPKMTQFLLGKVDAKIAQAEDGVGNTLLDIALLLSLEQRLGDYVQQVSLVPSSLSREVTAQIRYDEKRIKAMEKDLEELKEAATIIIPDEKRKRRTKIVWEVNTFVAFLEGNIAEAKANLDKVKAVTSQEYTDYDEEQEKEPKNIPEDWDEQDRMATLDVVVEALKNVGGVQRQLIHLHHVQQSVGAGLKEVGEREKTDHTYDEGLAEEEDPEELSRRRSMVFKHVYMDKDTF